MTFIVLILVFTGHAAFANDGWACAERLANHPSPELGLLIPDADLILRSTVDQTFEVTRAAAIAEASGHGARRRRANLDTLTLFRNAVTAELAAMTDLLDVVGRHTHVADAAIAERREILKRGTDWGERGATVPTVVRQFMPAALGFNVQDLIRIVRADDGALRSDEVQRALQRIVFGGVAFGARQVVWAQTHPFGWDLGAGVEATTLLQTLEPTVHQVLNVRGNLRASGPMMTQLLRELVTNADRTTVHRHGRIDADHRTVVIWTRSGDQLVLSIEDFGRPDTYRSARGTGASESSVDGVGIGRLRAHLIATFMGYALRREIKADGSGSIITILIPASHLSKTALRDRSAGAR